MKKIFTGIGLALLVFTGVANSQTPVASAKREAERTEKSQVVRLASVGKEVAPGVFEVDPNSVQGRRLILPPNGSGAARSVCIGKMNKNEGTCKGIYIEW